MIDRVPAGDPIDEQFLYRLLVLAVLVAVVVAVSTWAGPGGGRE